MLFYTTELATGALVLFFLVMSLPTFLNLFRSKAKRVS